MNALHLFRHPGRLAQRLHRDTSGLALLEFAFILPVVMTMSLTGAEMTNYITAKMRISQLALQAADDAGRMGSGTQLQAKQISETDINDLFIGAQYQSGELDLQANGRVILSDLEPVASPNTTSKYKIVWQRCYGTKTAHLSSYADSSHRTYRRSQRSGQSLLSSARISARVLLSAHNVGDHFKARNIAGRMVGPEFAR